MGKSFNNDVFNNDFNLNTINGLSISQEAINENKQDKPTIDLTNINLDDAKKEFNAKTKTPKKDTIKDVINQKEQLEQELKESKQPTINRIISEHIASTEQQKVIYTKKTMIFKQDYLDIIDGLASINNMQVKDVLNQLLEKSINTLDDNIREKALKTGKKPKQTKNTDKSIF